MSVLATASEGRGSFFGDSGPYLFGFNSSSVSVSGAIAERIPNSITMKNQIPKSYLHYDLYCNLIPNEDENAPYFQQVPRTWAFEVSYKGMVSIHSCFCNARFLLYLMIVDLLKNLRRLLAKSRIGRKKMRRSS